MTQDEVQSLLTFIGFALIIPAGFTFLAELPMLSTGSGNILITTIAIQWFVFGSLLAYIGSFKKDGFYPATKTTV